MKTVYIIVPVYNVENYLEKCLNSLVSQTYKNIEILCINDGSTDKSFEILLTYSQKYKNIKILEKKNGGLSSARNYGLNNVKNKDSYLMFVDSDDWISKFYIEKLVDCLETNNADIVCSDYYDVGDNYEEIIDDSVPEIISYSPFEGVKALFDVTMQSHGPCKLYKSSLWTNIRYDETIFFLEDQSTIYKTFLLSNKIVHTSYKGYYYYHRFGSICQSRMTNKKILSALKSYFYVYSYIFPFSNEENGVLRSLSAVLFLKAYLMLFPRFDFKNGTINEREQLSKYSAEIKAIKKDKIHRKLNFKNKLKFLIYRISKKMYVFIYSFFFKKYDN